MPEVSSSFADTDRLRRRANRLYESLSAADSFPTQYPLGPTLPGACVAARFASVLLVG